MAKLRPLEYLFSITNYGEYKQIMVLGIPIRIDRTKRTREICANLPVQSNKIVFMNYLGKPYGCNPKYIAEEIIKRKLPVEMVWIAEKIDEDFKKNFPECMNFVTYDTLDCIKELSCAKFWISNFHFRKLFSSGLSKKDNQYYIQTWHGSLGIKKIEKDVKNLVADKKWTEFSILNSQSVDCWISNSRFETEVYKQAFWEVANVEEFGHPRNDIFFVPEDDKNKIRDKVLSEYGIGANKKILLYAPSFRAGKNLDCYRLNIDKLTASLNKRFGGEWVVISRMHPRFKKKYFKKLNFTDKTIDASSYPDIQELLVAADCIVTDYSSCIFDFMLSRKPGFIFATDIESYNTERGFYYPLETTPFPIAVNNDELSENIENFDADKYQTEVEHFLKEKGCIEDGHAAQRVVDLIEKVMNGVCV